MSTLWRAIRSGNPTLALGAFFPLGAYEQVKAIADPQSDYRDRLLADFALDVAAAHRLLGRGARLVGVRVPETYVRWVGPGACYNRVGYFEVPNSRVVYRSAEGVHSFGIASMISWRGIWYVVHLGAVVRRGMAGIVDEPSIGPGTPAPSSTC
jgi:hypothetical protein